MRARHPRGARPHRAGQQRALRFQYEVRQSQRYKLQPGLEPGDTSRGGREPGVHQPGLPGYGV